MGVVPCELSLPEAEIFDRVRALDDELAATLESPAHVPLRDALYSSVYAVQQELLGLSDLIRRRRNVLAHGLAPAAGEREALMLASTDQWLNEITEISRLVDSTARDSKGIALRRLLSGRDTESLVIFASLPETGRYVASLLEEIPIRGLFLRPEIAGDTPEGFKGCLIVLDSLVPAVDLREFSRAIHYDLPGDARGWRERLGRLGPLGGRASVYSQALATDYQLADEPDLRGLTSLGEASVSIAEDSDDGPGA